MADEITDAEALDILNRLDAQNRAFTKIGALIRKYATAQKAIDSMDAQIAARMQQNDELVKKTTELEAFHVKRMSELDAQYKAKTEEIQANHSAQITLSQAAIGAAEKKIAALQKQIDDTTANQIQSINDHNAAMDARKTKAESILASLDKQIADRQAKLAEVRQTAKQQAQALQGL